MSHQQKHTELLNEQLSAEKTNSNNNKSNSELNFEKQYKDTPLFVRGNEEIGYFITIGQYKISKNYIAPSNAFDAIYERDYELLLGIIDAMFQFCKTYDQSKDWREVSYESKEQP